MLSVNHSVEEIDKYVANPHRTSQINPNLSSTNIFQLNQPKAVRFQPPFATITPPASNSPTPTSDKRDFFSIPSSLASSTTSIDTYAIPEEQSSVAWYTKLAPSVTWDVLLLCGFWYFFSIVSSNSTKAILSRFSYPVTLTQFQFLFNALLCLILFALLVVVPGLAHHFPAGTVPKLHTLDYSFAKFLTPSSHIISTTLPMGIFQLVGHITSHKATSMIPVSLVHTVKALSPITTILIYRLIYRANFKRVTYVTLIPLMSGIMLTCYKPKKSSSNTDEGYIGGLVYAFISMLIFVSQNIFAKKRLTYDAPAEPVSTSLPSYRKDEGKKLDKLTILLFCSILGFLFTMPFYVISEVRNDSFSLANLSPYLFFLIALNGFSHFMQSLLAFSLLGTISTVNYSIANIMKRIVVILFAFIWETSFTFSSNQSYGILLTAFGLYAYDRWGVSKKKSSISLK